MCVDRFEWSLVTSLVPVQLSVNNYQSRSHQLVSGTLVSSCPHHHCTTLLLFDYCTVVMQPLYHITPYCTRSHHNNQRSPSHNLGYKGYNQGFVKGDKLCIYHDFFLADCRSILSMSKIKVKISETKFLSFYETLVTTKVTDYLYNYVVIR